jgi:hypothetical protein
MIANPDDIVKSRGWPSRLVPKVQGSNLGQDAASAFLITHHSLSTGVRTFGGFARSIRAVGAVRQCTLPLDLVSKYCLHYACPPARSQSRRCQGSCGFRAPGATVELGPQFNLAPSYTAPPSLYCGPSNVWSCKKKKKNSMV